MSYAGLVQLFSAFWENQNLLILQKMQISLLLYNLTAKIWLYECLIQIYFKDLDWVFINYSEDLASNQNQESFPSSFV